MKPTSAEAVEELMLPLALHPLGALLLPCTLPQAVPRGGLQRIGGLEEGRMGVEEGSLDGAEEASLGGPEGSLHAVTSSLALWVSLNASSSAREPGRQHVEAASALWVSVSASSSHVPLVR